MPDWQDLAERVPKRQELQQGHTTAGVNRPHAAEAWPLALLAGLAGLVGAAAHPLLGLSACCLLPSACNRGKDPNNAEGGK